MIITSDDFIEFPPEPNEEEPSTDPYDDLERRADLFLLLENSGITNEWSE